MGTGRVLLERSNEVGHISGQFGRGDADGKRRCIMVFSTEKQGEVAIVAASGRLDAAGAPEIEVHCKALVQEGTKRLLLDLAGVEYVSSAGLRSLLVLAKTAKGAGGSLALCGLTPTVREVMCISGFDNILPMATDRAAAMELFK